MLDLLSNGVSVCFKESCLNVLIEYLEGFSYPKCFDLFRRIFQPRMVQFIERDFRILNLGPFKELDPFPVQNRRKKNYDPFPIIDLKKYLIQFSHFDRFSWYFSKNYRS